MKKERKKTELQLLAAQHTLTSTLALTLWKFESAVKMHSATVTPAAPTQPPLTPNNYAWPDQSNEIIAKILFFSF